MITKNFIINTAKKVGFDLVGVVPARALVDERKRFEEWLLAGNHSTLSYLERNIDKRFNAFHCITGNTDTSCNTQTTLAVFTSHRFILGLCDILICDKTNKLAISINHWQLLYLILLKNFSRFLFMDMR